MSKLAQVLLEKEKEERTGYLDLGKCGLTTIPDLSQMEWVETLILSNQWWDSEKRTWVYSQNKGEPNMFTQIDTGLLPESLIHIVLNSIGIGDGQFLERLPNLRTLYLSSNFIRNWQFLEKLSNLQTLDLSSNSIKDWRFLEKLSLIKKLDLRKNNISDGRFLENMPHLERLYLSSNNINNGQFLGKLSLLQTLSLGSNKIKDWQFLEELPQLQVLDISSNSIRDLGFLEKLSQLQSLNLNSNSIIDISSLEKLFLLQSLDLRSNNISNVGSLEKLSLLQKLDLSSNKIRDLRFLEKLPQLQILDLSYNNISDVQFLEKLAILQTLNLSYNNISNGEGLDKLSQLRTLYLNGNSISNWSFLEKLAHLQTLELMGSGVSDGQFLEQLTHLRTLYLSGNSISDVGFLEKLPQLQTLDLSSNSISDVQFLEKHPNLNQIDLSNNDITDLECLIPFFRTKEMEIVWKEGFELKYWEINIKDNPLDNPPSEIAKQGTAVVLEYFRQKEEVGISLLNEAKLILLGDGRAGKTSLANRMLNKELPQEADRTQGVDIIIGEYTFSVAEGSKFKLHIWDFAGQDKYKPLHQFFYTESAVYVLLADSGNAGTNYDDWFQTAKLFGNGSPVLVVLNEFREGIGYGTYNSEHWQKRFPGLLKEHFLVNLKTQKNLEQLKKAIHFQAQSLPHTQVEYPKNWAAIRHELDQRRDENFISFQEYLEICKKNELPEKESALILSGILHKIGACLHYQQSPLLRQHVILKNEWATEAVYKILEDQVVAEIKRGFFNWEDLQRIWSDEMYCEMQPQLLELMQQFKMAYPLPNSKEFVAPPLLPPSPPQSWEFPQGETLEMFLEYEFLPRALLTQFTVTHYTDIDEGRTLVWRNGVVLRWPNALAQVEKTKSQGRDAFNIRCQGKIRKDLLTTILKTFRDLHSEYKGIKASEIVPCPCSTCRTGQNKQHYFEFENLKNRLEKGRSVVECDKSLEEVDLVYLLGDLLLFDQLSPGQPVLMSQNTRSEQAVSNTQLSVPLAFFSYSRQDNTFLAEFQKHLRPLERSNKIRLWDDSKIRPGEEWDNEIQKNLRTANIIFLLLSPDFLNAEYIWDVEMAEALQRHESGTARVIPIKVRPCTWEDTPFVKLQGLPRKDMSLSTSKNSDETWVEVVKEIKGIIEEWQKKHGSS